MSWKALVCMFIRHICTCFCLRLMYVQERRRNPFSNCYLGCTQGRTLFLRGPGMLPHQFTFSLACFEGAWWPSCDFSSYYTFLLGRHHFLGHPYIDVQLHTLIPADWQLHSCTANFTMAEPRTSSKYCVWSHGNSVAYRAAWAG